MKTCKDCLCWNELSPPSSYMKDTGECRAEPPRVIQFPNYGRAAWPVTANVDWCMKLIPKEQFPGGR